MKTILLLGGFGFLGTNIIKHIDGKLSREYRVVVFDKFASHPAGVKFNSVVKTYSGDFSDEALIGSIFDENEIDAVFHCISTTVPATSFNAKFDIESNLMPTLSLLDCMVRHKVYDIVYISSGGAIYGTSALHPHKESDDVFPISSYGVVKLAIEKYLMQYAQLYDLKPLVLRLSNPYGPWHYSMKQGVCNVAVADAIDGRPFKVWGDGSGIKDYIYVEDFADILFRLRAVGIQPCVVNVGSGDCRSVNDILQMIKSIVPGFGWTHTNASMLDVSRFELDTAKLKSIIGEYDFTDMEEGLKKTFDWTKEICCV